MDENEEINTSNPSCSDSAMDCRIRCTNSESLRSMLDITLKHISEFVDKQNFKESSPQFINQFAEVFKTALEENIIVNELPWVVDKSKLSTPEKEDHKYIVDDAVLNQLSQTVTKVAHKRKFCPQQCSRMLDIKMKHVMQNLKKSRVEDSSSPFSLSPSKVINIDKRHMKKFSKFCKDFNSAQQAVEQQQREREKISKKIEVASSIQMQQRTVLKSVTIDETIAIDNR